MADPASDSGFLYDDQGFVDIVNSPFFDFNPHVDGSVEEYVERIIFTLVEAIEDQLSEGQWCIKAGNGEPIQIYDGRRSLTESNMDPNGLQQHALSIEMEVQGMQSKGEIHYIRDSDDEQPDSDEDPDDDLDI